MVHLAMGVPVAKNYHPAKVSPRSGRAFAALSHSEPIKILSNFT
jgi:hypothetical protein